MILTGPFTLSITGNTATVLACPRDDKALGYLLVRLLSGGEIDETELESWGLSVSLDEFVSIKREGME